MKTPIYVSEGVPVHVVGRILVIERWMEGLCGAMVVEAYFGVIDQVSCPECDRIYGEMIEEDPEIAGAAREIIASAVNAVADKHEPEPELAKPERELELDLHDDTSIRFSLLELD